MAWCLRVESMIGRARLPTVSSVGSDEFETYGGVYASTGTLSALKLRHFALHPEDTALQGYRAPYRVYSPAMARWITEDPLEMVDGPNVYGYVGDNPAFHVDPLGGWKIDGETLVNVLCNVACNMLFQDWCWVLPPPLHKMCSAGIGISCGFVCSDSTEQCKKMVDISPMGVPPGGPWPYVPKLGEKSLR